jgi:predicted ATP-grasp superfamily ATP-dependent carboligase
MSQKVNKCFIVFSGFNQRAIIAFLRTLEINHIEYVIIAQSPEDSIFLTTYKTKVKVIRTEAKLILGDIVNSINKVIQAYNDREFIIAPSTEALNRFLLFHRSEIEKRNVILPLVDIALYEKISDKYSFGILCKNHNIQVPEEFQNEKIIRVPCVAKPIRYSSKSNKVYNPVLILNEYDKKTFLENFQTKDFFYQKYINGRSYYLLYYFDRNGEVVKYSQENIAQQPSGKSILAAIPSTIHNHEISDKYESMLCSLNFHGLIMIEVRESDGYFFMIEANPRFWGPSQLFVDGGMNLFEAFLHDYGFIKKPKYISQLKKNIKYFWYGGMKSVLSNGDDIIYHTLKYGKISEFNNDWIKWDIYNREDTIEIYKKETKI